MIHSFIQPYRKTNQYYSAKPVATDLSAAQDVQIARGTSHASISSNLPHNWSNVPSHQQIVQACGCEKCTKCEEEEKARSTKKNGSVQHKLTISQPGDHYEREADQVAEQVMNMKQVGGLEEETKRFTPPAISRWMGGSTEDDVARDQGGETSDESQQQQAPEETTPENEESMDLSSLLSLKGRSNRNQAPSEKVTSQINSMHGTGEPLGKDLRGFFEARFQHDFSKVRIHTDSRAADTTKSLNAKAFTVGEDIAVSPEEYKPETTVGRKLLAHELTHVVQQSQGVQTIMRACDCPKLGYTDPSASVETVLTKAFPNLAKGDYCVTGAATKQYNCFAWSVGITNTWMDKVVDSAHGNNNGVLEYSDFDAFYAKQGLKPVVNKTPKDAVVVLYGMGDKPKHAARKTGTKCGDWESKLGENVRITHYPNQLAGGPVYGDIARYYVPK
jgi:hypothetical protein